jgi:hypothetical protein
MDDSPARRAQYQGIAARCDGEAAAGAVDLTPSAPHNPARTCIRRDARFERGGVSRAAKGADCKSAGLRLRRFESYLPHQPGIQGPVIGDQKIWPRPHSRFLIIDFRFVSPRCGCSSMVEQQPSKLMTRVRFPSPAPAFVCGARAASQEGCSPFTRLCDAGTRPNHSYLTAWHGGLAATVRTCQRLERQ